MIEMSFNKVLKGKMQSNLYIMTIIKKILMLDIVEIIWVVFIQDD